MEEVDKAIEVYKPDSWKSYTIGDPLAPSKFPWRLDDEQVMYPFYEKAVKAGITTICIHKGLLPPDYEKSFAGVWEYATAWDIGKAAKDWPQMTFVVYHSALRAFLELPEQAWTEFEQTGRIKWATDLAEIPAKFGVNNVYAEIGTSFANSAVAHPKFSAALLGTLIKGFGVERVLWGTDSVWYGSPQWQIEALRRLEIPEDMQKKYGFAPLGSANGPVKQMIFGTNAARLYRLNLEGDRKHADAGLFGGPARQAEERVRVRGARADQLALRLRSRRLSGSTAVAILVRREHRGSLCMVSPLRPPPFCHLPSMSSARSVCLGVLILFVIAGIWWRRDQHLSGPGFIRSVWPARSGPRGLMPAGLSASPAMPRSSSRSGEPMPIGMISKFARSFAVGALQPRIPVERRGNLASIHERHHEISRGELDRRGRGGRRRQIPKWSFQAASNCPRFSRR